MRHYDIVLLIHPNHSDDIGSIVEKQKESLTAAGADVYRVEDWGRKNCTILFVIKPKPILFVFQYRWTVAN